MHERLEEWSDWLRAGGASENTIRTRTTSVRLLCAHAGTADPVSIATMQAVRWLASCTAAWTRCTYSTSARAWFAWLVARGYRIDNPMDGVPVPKTPRTTARPAPSDAIRAVLTTQPRRARAYVTLATFLGLRVHEIAKVRGEEFRDGWYYVTGKGDKAAAIPVHPAVEQLRNGFPEQGFWFPGRDDGHVWSPTVTKTIGEAFRRCGFEVTAHQLRHWYGTHAQRVGKDSRVTQQLLRHANLASSQIYTEVADLSMQETIRRLTV
ncbi:tyrosine-type recombinase/integrase [Kribbella sp. WER1]